MNTTAVMLGALQLCLKADAGETQQSTSATTSSAASAGGNSSGGGSGSSSGQSAGNLTETILELMEKLLVEAASSLKSVADYQRLTCSASVDQERSRNIRHLKIIQNLFYLENHF